jgi:hypothetical protein
MGRRGSDEKRMPFRRIKAIEESVIFVVAHEHLKRQFRDQLATMLEQELTEGREHDGPEEAGRGHAAIG